MTDERSAEAGEESVESKEPTIPQTTTEELQTGLFNIALALAHHHMANGLSSTQATLLVGATLEHLATVFNEFSTQEEG